MAIAEQNYVGNGITKLFPFTFEYLDDSHVKATIDNNAVDITLATATTAEFPWIPPAGSKIRIYRETPAGSVLAKFTPGASVRAQDLNAGFKQLLYTLQEVVERSVLKVDTVLSSTLNMAGNRITNLGTPSDYYDAATKGYIDAQVDNIEFLASTANSLNNDGYPELRKVFGNTAGLTAAAYHQETGRGGYFHPNSGTSEGQLVAIKGIANALIHSKDSRFAWLLQMIVKPLVSVMYRGVEAPSDPTTITRDNLWIPHWLFNVKGDFIGEEIKYDLVLNFVNGQANIPPAQYGNLVRTVYKVISTDAVLEWVNPFSILKAGTEYPLANFTVSGTGCLVELTDNTYTGPAKVIHSTYTGAAIGKNQPYEAWPCWRQLAVGETACAVDALAWAVQAYDLCYQATKLPIFKKWVNATLASAKYAYRIDDDTYWAGPDLSGEFALYPYSTFITREYTELTRTSEGYQYLDLPVGTPGTEITYNKNVEAGSAIQYLDTQTLKVQIKSDAAFPILFWLDTADSGFDATKRYYAGATLTPVSGDISLADFQELSFTKTYFLRADDGTTPFPGGTTQIKRVGYTVNDPSTAGKIIVKEIKLDIESGYPYCPGAQPFTANTMYEKLIAWRGPIYTGYQSAWMWHKMGETTPRNNCLQLLADAQTDYTSKHPGIIGPWSPVYYLPKPDNTIYGPAGTFGWSGPDPNTFWGGWQYRIAYDLGHLLLEDPTITAAATQLDAFCEWVNGAWPDSAQQGPPPTNFPALGAPSIISGEDIYFTSLLGAAVVYRKKQGLGTAQTNIDLLTKAIKALDRLYQNNESGGENRGAFMPATADVKYYGYHHGEAMFFLGELLKYLEPADYAALGTTKSRIEDMCFGAGGWAERHMR
jgi:hypothetical protein